MYLNYVKKAMQHIFFLFLLIIIYNYFNMKNTTILKGASGFVKKSKRWQLVYLTLVAFLSFTTAFSQTGTISIGSGTATSANRVPIYSCYGYNYSQQIISSSEYAASGGVAGDITSVSYYYSSGGTNMDNWNEWTVYVGHTTKTEFSSSSDWEPLVNLTQVYSGTITPVSGNWFEITFTTPFNYDGTSNLVIAIDENVPGYSCTAAFGSYSSTPNTGIFYYSDGTNPDPASPPTGTRTATLPRLQFMGAVASCLPPNAVAFSDITPTSATVFFTEEAAATDGYEYYVSTNSTDPIDTATPTGTIASGDTSASLTSLMPNTDYYVWVRSDCGGGSTSSWSVSESFTTLCIATDIPYMLDGDDATTPAMPDCVTTQNVGSGNNWTTNSNPGYGFDGQVFRYNYSSANAGDAWFFTQGLNLTAGTSYRVSYRYGNNSTFYNESLDVAYGMEASDAGMTEVIASYPTVSLAGSTETFVDITPATSGVYYIGFNAYSIANQFSLYVDEISVTLTPTCEPVGDITATTTGFTTADVMWEESASLPANGYEYYVTTDATMPAMDVTITGTTAAGELMASLTDLAVDTEYYVWVRAICTDTDMSPWEISNAFYTGYCTPAPSSVDGDGITNVELGTISNATGEEATNYGNYSMMSTEVALGSEVAFAITFETGLTYGTKIWVDWNNDADFDDEGELVFTGLSESANPTTLSGTFMVPADAAVVGMHRVRIGGTDNNSGGSPCYTGSWGSYEDYSINAFMPDAPAITGFTPADYCAVEGDITITGTALTSATLDIGGTAVDIASNTDTEIVATVPEGVSGVVSVTTISGTATTTDTFEVTAPADFAISGTDTTICNGDDTALITITEGAADFDTFVWSPADTASGNATDGFTLNPTETTTYTLTASQSAGSCEISVEYTVNVNPVPDPVTVTPAMTIACEGSPVELTAEGGATIIPVAYCIPTLGSTGASGDFIGDFTFADLSNLNSGDTPTDYTYYSDMMATVTAGETYDISVDAGGTWAQRFRVWIDYNMDGEFSADESVFDTTSSSTALQEGTVTVPATAFNGMTRMRVGCRYGSTGIGAGEACGHTGFGEWEDYDVMISGGTNAVNYVWAPIDGLFEDAAGTIPYTDSGAQTVYAMPGMTMTYTATVSTDLGCTASDSAEITIISTPAPTGDMVADFTTAATVADLMATGDNIQWYATEDGNDALDTDDMLTSGTYYATQTQNGCESQERLAVMVTIPEMDWVNLQWPPMLEITEGTTGMVYAQGFEPGVTPGAGPGIGVMAWIGISSEDTDPSTWTMWVPMTFNTQVGNNDEYVAQIGDGLEPGTYYYASRFQYLEGPYSYGGYNADGGSFWDGNTYVSGMLTVTCGTMPPMADAMQSFCDAATVADLMAMGDNVQWYASETDMTPLADTDAVMDGMTYYASQTMDCESINRTAVMVTINNTPIPTGETMQMFENGAMVSDLMATGMDIMWYDAETDGMMLNADDMLMDGMTYYASQTVDGCESQDRLAVTVMINSPAVDYVNLQYPGTVTVSIAQPAMVYVQVYEPGVTEGTGPGNGIMAWIGISNEDTDPSTWTTWIPATYNMQSGMNDEYVAAIGEDLEPGTYYYASRVQYMDGPFKYGGFSEEGGNTWDGIEYVSGVLNVLCDTPSPSGETQQVVVVPNATGIATVQDIEIDGTDIVWYATEDDALSATNPLSSSSQVIEGETYYATQTINGCTSVVSLGVTVVGLLGDIEFDLASFSAYPNPVTDVLTIQYSSDITSITVHNMLGQQVMTAMPNATEAQLNMSALSDGTYVVNVTSGNMVKTIKVVKRQ